MSAYDSYSQANTKWTRGQIVRTTIIAIEFVVLFAAVLLTVMQSPQVVSAPDIEAPQVASIAMSSDDVVTTVYVSSMYRVYVVQDGLHRLVARLNTCDNRYVEARFDGVLTNLHDASMNYGRSVVHAASFLARDYSVIESNGTRVDIVLDSGSTYTITLHCNGEFGASIYASQDDHSSTIEDLVSEASRTTYDYYDYRDSDDYDARADYDYGYGYGCSGGDHQ